MKKSRAVIILILILGILGGMCYYSGSILAKTKPDSDGGITLGLDLSGGVSITYEIVEDNPSQTDINDTIAKLEERAEHYSTEYAVYQTGDDRITVEIPGVKDANAVLEELGSPGSLYFITQNNSEGKANYSYNSALGQYTLNYELEELIENGSVILSGNDVRASEAVYQGDSFGNNEPVVSLSFTDEAASIFAEATQAAAGKYSIGIYYDDHFISVPNVNSAITDGNCVIEGNGWSFEDAEELATFIRVGAISLELEELESSVVGAQLGSEAISTSLKAGGIGLLLVMLFMIIMYAVPGVAASIALAVYTTVVVAFIYLFEITLTLPGIAGIILGIGMAVDANVVIFARIREEIANGLAVNNAIKAGYKKALSAIIDGNVTTFIAAVVLMLLGSGTVKGFAYTLIISIVVSMFTALVAARYIMYAFYALGLKNEKLYGRAKERKPIEFIRHKTVYFIISIVVIAAGFVGMGAFGAGTGRALNFGLEFVGGTSTTADFGKEYSFEEIEGEIVPSVSEITGDSAIQATAVDNSTSIVLKTRTLNLDERDALSDMLVEQFGVDESTITIQSISSTISGEMRKDAIVSVIVACICMLIYIWFRFKDIRFAASAIIALLHDVLVVLAAYALLRIPVGSTFIACMLTIVGYSINDTIVIFDRVRENMHGLKSQSKEGLAEVSNRSLTQTLSRSINTSITTAIMVLLLYILGVASIREFALPLLVGLVSGAYSSICIATEIWYLMKIHFKKKGK